VSAKQGDATSDRGGLATLEFLSLVGAKSTKVVFESQDIRSLNQRLFFT
jgi:hypothetical protein